MKISIPAKIPFSHKMPKVFTYPQAALGEPTPTLVPPHDD